MRETSYEIWVVALMKQIYNLLRKLKFLSHKSEKNAPVEFPHT